MKRFLHIIDCILLYFGIITIVGMITKFLIAAGIWFIVSAIIGSVLLTAIVVSAEYADEESED